MFRVTKLGGKYYAVQFDELEDQLEDIEGFIESGDVVIIGPDLDYIADILDIESSEIETV